MELDLVQKVELRLLLVKSDDSFNASISTFLIPLLQKLTSSNVEVVTKVIEVLQFIKKRRRESENIALPLDKLVEFYRKSVNDVCLVRQNRQVLAFIALECALSNAQLPLDTFVDGLRLANVPIGTVSYPEAIADLAAEQFSLFLVMLNKAADSANSKSNNTNDVNTNIECDVYSWDHADLAVIQERLPILMSLDLKHRNLYNQFNATKEQVQFFTNHGEKLGISFPQTNDAPMKKCRTSVVQLAQTFPDIFSHTLIAGMGDQILDINRKCRLEVLKLKEIDLDYLGKFARWGNSLLRTNALDLLAKHKSYAAVNFSLIKSALRQDDLKLRLSSLILLRDYLVNRAHILSSESATPEAKSDAASLSQLLEQYIFDDGWPRAQAHSNLQTQLRQICYELIGYLSVSQSTTGFLLQSLDRDSPDMASAIQKSLSNILATGHASIDTTKLLDIMMYSRNNRTRYSAVCFARELGSENPLNRAILLLGIDKSKNSSDVAMESQLGLINLKKESLPSFENMFHILNELISWKIASSETVEACAIYLFACLTKWQPSTIEWSQEVTILLESSEFSREIFKSINEDNLQVYLRWLLGLMLTNTGQYHSDLVQQLASKLIINLKASSSLSLLSESLNVHELSHTVEIGISSYSSFLAEYLPLLAPEIKFQNQGRFTVLFEAYKTALYGRMSTHVLTALSELTRSGVEVDMDAYFVLSATNFLKSCDEMPKNMGNQLIKACIAMNLTVLSAREEVLKELFRMTPKSFDDIVANGEAISICVSGWSSQTLQKRFPYLVERYSHSRSESLHGNASIELEEMALRMIVEGIRGSPQSRRIASVRLLCLTQNSFYDMSRHAYLADGVQKCFMNLLSDSDDVTQEAAGRGISILFERSDGSKSIQQQLLSTLLSSFTDDKVAKQNTKGTLTAETQVFEPGTLPSDPRGTGSISTYKDIMNLANETGDSSLVYKFMSLGSNSKIWAGRKGIAFSLQQIISKSEISHQIMNGSTIGYKLIPNLFRYLYDPVEDTKQAMKHIWTTLIPGPLRHNVIKRYLDDILKVLNEGVVDRQWRIRQASCSALADLISNGTIDGNVDILRVAFRAVDDIKESVSDAGKELLTSLTNSIVRKSNKDGECTTNLNDIIPFLLGGLNREATARFSLDILLKLSETNMFKPYAAEVLTELTLQLSSLEPQALNYLAQHLGQSEIDKARLSGLQSSPIMQAIESMVERGMPSIEELWVILPRIVSNSVGVPSKLAASRVLTLTCLQTYGGKKFASRKLMRATSQELFGQNKVCSESYASTMGYLFRHTPLNLVVDFMNEIREKYISSEPDDTDKRYLVSLALKKISANASDVFSTVASVGLPLAYIGMIASEEDQNEPKLFKNVWDENTGGSASLKLYASDILKLACEILEKTNSRLLKVVAARSVNTVMNNLNGSTSTHATNGEVQRYAELTKLALSANVVGRNWPKKEHLSDALEATALFLSRNLPK